MITLKGGFSGINLNDKQQVQSVTFGGLDVNGVFQPDQVVLTIETNRYSTQVFGAFATKTSGMKVVVDGYRPDAAGKSQKFVTLTFTGVQVAGFHFAGTTRAQALETVNLTFGDVKLEWDPSLSVGEWQLPA